MKKSDLDRALEPVREYFSGRDVNANTVLAAYLRSEGLPASGQHWERAKMALNQGADFSEAVRVAAAAVSQSERPVPVAGSDRPTPYNGSVLRWFPKQFGPGDLDGVGAKRLLGTPDLEPAWVLVRETAQNSWDARGPSQSVDFVINLRQLEPSTVDILRQRVFTSDAPKTGLAGLLKSDTFWALEVSDRGTVGLGGPIRNDLSVEQGKDTNFIDLIFNIGAPRDVHLGGGTYGFGKTISYVVSSVGTVIIASRCEGSDGLEHRLIGSTIGDGFDMNGYRYTGRHWWGNVVEHEDRVEPVVGDLAEELESLLFAKRFNGDATGTSVLILDPRLGGESPEKDVQMLADAVVWNLWPKLVPDEDGKLKMTISVQLNGKEISLSDPASHPTLSGHVDCLRAVRAAQAGRDKDSLGLSSDVTVYEVKSERPRKLLGHLGLARYPVRRDSSSEDRSHWVTLMRNQAELVVKPLTRQSLASDDFQWAGVFKPVADVDDSFALAEPPAHDDWIAKAIPNRAQRTDVNVAITRIRALADEFIAPRTTTSSGDEAVQSAAVAGDALAGLLGGITGSAPSPVKRTSGRHSIRPRADIVAIKTLDAETPGWTHTRMDVQLTGSGREPIHVVARVRVGVDGGSEDDEDAIHILGWMTSSDSYEASDVEFAPNEIRRFEFQARADLAIDVEVKAVQR